MIILLKEACQIAAIMLCLCVTIIVIVIVITIIKIDQPTVLKRIPTTVLEFKLWVKKFILIVRSSIVH